MNVPLKLNYFKMNRHDKKNQQQYSATFIQTNISYRINISYRTKQKC